MIVELLAFLAAALLLGLVGLAVGMLLARPLMRLADRGSTDDEGSGDERD